ncbi:hypothetical protein PCC9214_05348 [Planktothrix tepida]|uniref:Uncharacterized protein n=1 Tax=Planktothrix tepida PCC 9214 TaxID=671072 RepID=A0A1J1LHQ7_9CYAN|nr:hypothetical protein [Planktothrix tepida]CAD5984865.1 hypothetical protein PCC9214_05310 [Planktothrix tepida]CAD5985140.1 hypothetical protein PCC9214_05348 [Planktothrix tepida]CUR32141.1 conserved hypothetical protein [Planktothrix tepida PCC 9214]
MAKKSQIMYAESGTEKFYFKASIADYTTEVAAACGFTLAPASLLPRPLVDQSELVRCGLCTRLQVRLANGENPPTTASLLVAVTDASAAMAYFNAGGKTLHSKTVLSANFKRDKFYV